VGQLRCLLRHAEPMSNDLYSQQAEGIRIYSKVVTPECFLTGGQFEHPLDSTSTSSVWRAQSSHR
jgi:hypothetical protein